MILDTSVLIAIILGEPDAHELTQRIYNEDTVLISAATLAETYIVIQSKAQAESGFDPQLFQNAVRQVDALIKALDITVVPFGPKHARVAATAFENFGKGHHPAKLNFGDCMAYAAARESGEPLFFKGQDFRLTDIPTA